MQLKAVEGGRYCHVWGVAWLITVGSRFDDYIYCTSLLQLKLIMTIHTLNSFLITRWILKSLWSLELLLELRISLTLHTSHFTLPSCLRLSLMLPPTVSRVVCLGIKHPSGAYEQIFITVRQSRVCWCGAHSLTRRWVCRLKLLLALARAVILGSESSGTRDHILLSQIRDFPFRRILRLAGLRWRYSTPPPHRNSFCLANSWCFIIFGRPCTEHLSSRVQYPYPM
jgi:hypothetical protein